VARQVGKHAGDVLQNATVAARLCIGLKPRAFFLNAAGEKMLPVVTKP
jgi:hypothetical protein